MTNYLTPNNYRDLGKMIYRTCPEIAARCLTMISKAKPEFIDVSLISEFFELFCKHNDIDLLAFQSLRKTDKVYMRMVFIAIIIKLYNPDLLTSYSTSRMKKQLRIELSDILKVHRTWVSQKVKTVCFHLEVYDEFEDDVTAAIFVLKSKLKSKLLTNS